MSDDTYITRPPAPILPVVRRASYAPETTAPQFSRYENRSVERRRAIASTRSEIEALVRIYEPSRRSFGEMPGDMPLGSQAFRTAAAHCDVGGQVQAARVWESRAVRMERWERAYDRLERLHARVGNWHTVEESDEALIAEARSEMERIVREARLDGGPLRMLERIGGEA